MGRQPFLSFFREPLRRIAHVGHKPPKQYDVIPWFESPLDEKDGDLPHLYRHSDATPTELFYDLALVANLSTFTATHEINNVEALWAYVGFLGVIWFTWLQVTLFDIRFARDSVFERICKAIQLGTMIGFASAGSRFTTRVRDDNVWAFKALTVLLAISRLMLAVQYSINLNFVRKKMKAAVKGMLIIIGVLLVSSAIFTGLFFAFGQGRSSRAHVWIVWFAIFAVEMVGIMGISGETPGIGFEHTHLNVRMGLLTLIIIGEGVISVTRIVNKTVGGGGWTRWSFVHILGVTTTVYLVWQSYFDLSPRMQYGRIRQQIWTQLHFPFHIVLILLLEGSQILALTLDIALKLKYLGETILFVCEEPRPDPARAIRLLNSTIVDMEIDYSRGALKEKEFIDLIMNSLVNQPLCPSNDSNYYSLTEDRAKNLMRNVTAALFSSMGITPSKGDDTSQLDKNKFLMMYLQLLAFVYVYFFVVASLTMVFFSIFTFLTRRHLRKLYRRLAVGIRLALALLLAGLILFVLDFNLAYHFMISPAILFIFTLVLFTVLLVDRLLDWLSFRETVRNTHRKGSESGSKPMPSTTTPLETLSSQSSHISANEDHPTNNVSEGENAASSSHCSDRAPQSSQSVRP